MKVREICHSITDGSHNPPQGVEESKYLMLSSKNIFDDEITVDDPRFLTEEAFQQEDKRTRIAPGDVLLTIVGTVGRTAVVSHDMPRFTLQRSVAVLHPKRDVCLSRFLMYALRSKRAYIEKTAKGVAQKGIYLGEVGEIDLPIPTKEQQESVIDTLDKVCLLVQTRQRQLRTLDTLIKARFVEMFRNVKQEDTLLNLCNIIDYRGKTPEKVENGLPFITAKNVRMHQLSIEPREYISKETYDSVMTRGFPREGDVLFTTEAPLGNVCRLPHFDTEFYVGQRIVTLQTEKLVPAYLEYALDTDAFRRKVESKSSGSTVTGIRVRLLEQLTVPVPNRTSQDKFAAFVSQVDKSKVVVQKALDEAQMLFDSLMQEYFG